MKICKLLASAFVYGLFLIMASALWAGDKGLSWEGISSANLNKEGFVRIIIGVDVPNIAKLSAASSQHQVITPQEAKSGPRTGAINADRALEQAIGQAADLVLSNLAKSDAKINRRYSAFPFVALSVNKKAFEALKANPGVTSIEVDIPVGLPLPVRDNGPKGAGGPSSANANWGPPKIGADTAWASGYTGAGWYVAILDTGIRKTHEMFAGKTIVEACYALGEDGVGPAGDCPNGLTSQTGSGSAVHYEGSYEGYDHGTHVAGIAAGWKSDGSVAGVAKDANIIAVKIFSKFSADYCGDTACVLSWNSDQLAGLNYVYTLRNTYSIAAANMSLGGDSYSAACDGASQKAGVDALRSVGIATAIATGNNGWCGAISSPGCISSSIAVSSSTSGDTKSDFSNWHNTLTTLFAPGSEIYSSTGASNTSYGIWSGTSMATPHVTGAWAILRQNRPSESVTSILSAVLAGGVNISPCGDGSKPRIYIPNALAAADTTPDSFTFIDQTNAAMDTEYVSNTITVTGINAATPISIVSGRYSINGAAYTSASGTVNYGNTVRVRKMSSENFSTTKSATLTIGGVSDTFNVTTMAADTTPDAFHFTDRTGAALNTEYKSNAITVTGINTASPISVTGGTYSINGGTYTSAIGSVSLGNTVKVRKVSAATYSTTKSATLTIGGVSDTFSVTTMAAP